MITVDIHSHYGEANMNHRATPELYSGGYSTSSELPYYPPRHNGSNPSFYRSQNDLSMNSKNGNVSVNERLVSRTPSPTPSEAALLSRKGVLDTEKLLKWRFWIRKEWICKYIDTRRVADLLMRHCYRVLRYCYYSFGTGYSNQCVRPTNCTCITT